MATLGCGEYNAMIMERGGVVPFMELPRLIKVSWERVRDDVSLADVRVAATPDCCGDLGSITTAFHELHLWRNGVKVWEGPIHRVEYNRDDVEIFAADILWVARKTALSQGYNKTEPNQAKCGYMMNWLLAEQTFAKNGDPWNGLAGINWVQGSDDPSTASAVKAWSMTTWEDFDKYAEDRGMDYTVVGRDIYFFDTHLRWRTIEPLLVPAYLTNGLSLVEYGNQFATRVIVTNGNGYNAQRQAPAWAISKYGYIDMIVTSSNEAAATEAPTAAELTAWGEQAQSLLDNSFPAPVRVRLPENSVVSPDAPYDINDLIAGAWIEVEATDLCRATQQFHKLDQVDVDVEDGEEVVKITTQVGPENVVDP